MIIKKKKKKKMRKKKEEIKNDLDTIDFEAIDSQEKNLKYKKGW